MPGPRSQAWHPRTRPPRTTCVFVPGFGGGVSSSILSTLRDPGVHSVQRSRPVLSLDCDSPCAHGHPLCEVYPARSCLSSHVGWGSALPQTPACFGRLSTGVGTRITEDRVPSWAGEPPAGLGARQKRLGRLLCSQPSKLNPLCPHQKKWDRMSLLLAVRPLRGLATLQLPCSPPGGGALSSPPSLSLRGGWAL